MQRFVAAVAFFPFGEDDSADIVTSSHAALGDARAWVQAQREELAASHTVIDTEIVCCEEDGRVREVSCGSPDD